MAARVYDFNLAKLETGPTVFDSGR